MKKKIGILNLENFSREEFDEIVNMENEVFDRDDEWLKSWALVLNSPWGSTDASYLIKPNANNRYSDTNGFMCTYAVVGYECMTAEIIGYGNSEIEALQNCINLFKSVQKKYNPDDDSI